MIEIKMIFFVGLALCALVLLLQAIEKVNPIVRKFLGRSEDKRSSHL